MRKLTDRLAGAIAGWRAGAAASPRSPGKSARRHQRVGELPSRRLRAKRTAHRSGRRDADGFRALTSEAPAIVIAAAPLLLPLIAIAMVGDTALLRVILWQGSLPALLTAMVIGLLPLVVGCAVFVLLRGTAGPPRFRVAVRGAVIAACLVTPFTPVTLAALQWVLLAFLFLAVSPVRRRRRRLVTATLVLLPFLGAAILYWVAGYHSFAQIRDLAFSRALYGLPREVILTASGVRPYYVASVDDQYTTVIADHPVLVSDIANDDIVGRIPCRNVERKTQSTFVVLVFGATPGGTPFCGPLTVCLDRSVPAQQRERRVQEDCVRRSS